MTSLLGTLPALATAEAQLRALATEQGLAYRLADFGALRTQADTARILGYRDADYAKYVASLDDPSSAVPIGQWRPIAPFGRSYHNFGAAFDVVMTQGQIEDLGALAEQAGLRWGGTFPANRNDPAHFELPITLADAQAQYDALPLLKRTGVMDLTLLVIVAFVGAVLVLARGH